MFEVTSSSFYGLIGSVDFVAFYKFSCEIGFLVVINTSLKSSIVLVSLRFFRSLAKRILHMQLQEHLN